MTAFPPFQLVDADGKTVAERDLLGHPAVVYLARHPGWPVCRSYLRRVVEAAAEIEAAGARLVVVTPQSADRAATWREEVGLGAALVIADPERALYKALGARRPKPLWALRPRVAAAGMRAIIAGERPSVEKGDDTRQLGADVVVDKDGEIVFLHLAADAADRTPPQELLSVLRGLDSGADPQTDPSLATAPQSL